jgi:hypothetical protein
MDKCGTNGGLFKIIPMLLSIFIGLLLYGLFAMASLALVGSTLFIILFFIGLMFSEINSKKIKKYCETRRREE